MPRRDPHAARRRLWSAVPPMRHRDVLALHRRAAARDDVIALAGGLPADELLPAAALASALAQVAAMGPVALQYGWPEGDAAVRSWIADRLRTRGAAITADDVIVTAGAQQAISLCAAAIGPRAPATAKPEPPYDEIAGAPATAKPEPPYDEIAGGTHVPRAIAVDPVTYPAALVAFERGGEVEVIDVTCAGAGRAAARYVIAGANNPDGSDRLTPVRDALVAGTAPVIVDEAYVELRFDGRIDRPLIADARDRTWHVGTVSKTVCPGLRIGWLIPPPAMRDAVLEAKHAADLQTGSLAQAAFARLISSVDLDAIAERARNLYAARAHRLIDSLRRRAPAWRFAEPEGGFSIWVETDEPGDDVELLERAIAGGVSFDPGRLFRASRAGAPIAFRLSFSHAPIHAIDEGIRRLSSVFHQRRRAA